MVENGWISKEEWYELLKKIPATSLEVVPIHIKENGDLQVFLTQRPPEDEFYPSQWHCPGTMIMNGDISHDGSFTKPWQRLKEKEFERMDLPEPILVRTKILGGARGNVTECIHFVLVPGDLSGGQYFDIDELPRNLVEVHHEIIREGVNGFRGEVMSGRLVI